MNGAPGSVFSAASLEQQRHAKLPTMTSPLDVP